MRILMFGWEFPPHISGGLGTACYGMTKGLVACGHEVLFVVPKAFGDESDHLKIVNASEVGLTCHTIEQQQIFDKIKFVLVNSSILPYTTPERYEQLYEEDISKGIASTGKVWSQRYTFSGGYGKSLMDEVARYAALASQIATNLEGQFDVIHAHDWLTYHAGIAAKASSGKPLVIQVHATEFDRGTGSTTSTVYQIEKQGMEAADMVITVSNLTRKIVIEKYGCDPSKVETVYNAVTFDPNNRKEVRNLLPDKIVTFLGRVTYQKGPEYFVQVAKRVLQYNPNVRFVMAGDGDMLPEMVRLVAHNKIANKFHFAGFLRGEEVSKMLAISDVYIMPSVSEPFGISPLEAMYCSVPVIISKQSGVAEILQNAIKWDYWDVENIADSICAILEYPVLHKYLMDKGLEEVTHLKWTNVAANLERIYNKAVERNN